MPENLYQLDISPLSNLRNMNTPESLLAMIICAKRFAFCVSSLLTAITYILKPALTGQCTSVSAIVLVVHVYILVESVHVFKSVLELNETVFLTPSIN